MPPYHFQTPEFGISDTGIHLLRGGYNHETIQFADVATAEIKRGKEFKNWLILLVFSNGVIGFAIVFAWRLYHFFQLEYVSRIYAREFLVPVIPLLVGGYCLYLSLRNGVVLRIVTNDGKNKIFMLRDLVKANQMPAVIALLRKQLDRKFQDQLASAGNKTTKSVA